MRIIRLLAFFLAIATFMGACGPSGNGDDLDGSALSVAADHRVRIEYLLREHVFLMAFVTQAVATARVKEYEGAASLLRRGRKGSSEEEQGCCGREATSEGDNPIPRGSDRHLDKAELELSFDELIDACLSVVDAQVAGDFVKAGVAIRAAVQDTGRLGKFLTRATVLRFPAKFEPKSR